MSSTVNFTSGATSVDVNGPGGATQPDLLPMTAHAKAANNAHRAYRLTDTKVWQWRMQLTALTNAMRDALENFFTDTVFGPNTSFTYTHTDGSSYTAYFLQDELRWTRHDGATWDVEVVLRLTVQPD